MYIALVVEHRRYYRDFTHLYLYISLGCRRLLTQDLHITCFNALPSGWHVDEIPLAEQ